MTHELQKYYESRFTMFSSEAWCDLLEDIEEMVASLEHVSHIKDFEDLKYKQGQLDILNWIQALKNSSETAYEELLEETF